MDGRRVRPLFDFETFYSVCLNKWHKISGRKTGRKMCSGAVKDVKKEGLSMDPVDDTGFFHYEGNLIRRALLLGRALFGEYP